MLPEETSKVWDFLKFQKAMGGFVLLRGICSISACRPPIQ